MADQPKTSNSSPVRKQTAPRGLPVELGYVEESEPWRLESHFFPSKVGGRPAWLSFKPLPTPDTIRCGVCQEPCVFLLQVYAPLDNVRPSSFHRTLYIFVCRNPECCTTNKADNFVALRCQLPRENDFYSSEPLSLETEESGAANEEIDSPKSPILNSVKRQDEYNDHKICVVCACAAEKQCAQCKKVHYCCKSHQEIDWKSGGHKEICGKSDDKNSASEKRNPLAFPEFELVTETERYVEQKAKERSESDRLKAYEEFVQQQRNQGGGGGGGMTEESVQHLEAMAKAADKDFKLFRRRLEQNPEQVLRYQRAGVPLWADRVNTPQEKDITPCQYCGGPRIFEFQIMPHLLSYLDVDSVGKSLDWATVAVYTCKDCCDIPEYGYAREFLWKQDFTE